MFSLYYNTVIENPLYFELYPVCVGDEFDFHFAKDINDKVKKIAIGENISVTSDESSDYGYSIGKKSSNYSNVIAVDDNFHAKVMAGSRSFLQVYFFIDHGGWFEKASTTFYVYTYNRNGYSMEPFIETSKSKDDYHVEYESIDSYDYIFSNGEQLSASFIKFTNGELSRTKETLEKKIISAEYKIIYNKNHISVSIDENGVITSSADKISGIVVEITVKVQDLETNEITTYVRKIGLSNSDTRKLN